MTKIHIEIGEVVPLVEEAEDLVLCLRKLVVDVEVMEHLQVEEMVLSPKRMILTVMKSYLDVMARQSLTSSVLDVSFTDIIVENAHTKDALEFLHFN